MKRDFDKYIVLKTSDLIEGLSKKDKKALQKILKKVDVYREVRDAEPMECVVVQKGWPMYEKTWNAIEEWVDDNT